MQPNNNQILDTTNRASESILRNTVPELLEDAISLAKQGATPDQLEGFMMGVIAAIDAAKTLGMSHTGEGRGLRLRGLGAVATLGQQFNVDDIEEEVERAAEEMAESYNEALAQWESERADLIGTIEGLQAKLAQALAPKNGHRTVAPEEEDDEDEDYGEEELVSAPKKAARRDARNSRDRVRGMLAGRRIGGSGRGFGRGR